MMKIPIKGKFIVLVNFIVNILMWLLGLLEIINCKILYMNNNDNLVENAINSRYILCSGVEDEYLEIINKYGEIELVPILDSKGKLNFKILEDDEKGTLAKDIKKVANK